MTATRRDEKSETHVVHFTFVIGLIFFILSIQISGMTMAEEGKSGDRNLCYYNDFCQRPALIGDSLVFAFNNIYSNIGYLVAGLSGAGYLLLLKKRFSHWRVMMPTQFSTLWALCICLFFIGADSFAYHLCPTPSNFQIDLAMMLSFSLLTMGDVWGRYFEPRLHGWLIYAVLAFLLLVNWISTMLERSSDSTNRWAEELGFRLALTVLMGLLSLFFLWRIWFRLSRHHMRLSYTIVTVAIVTLALIFLWADFSNNLSQSLLTVFIALFSATILFDLLAQLGIGQWIETRRLPPALHCRDSPLSPWHGVNPPSRFKIALLFIFLLGGWLLSGIVALYYFLLRSDSDKNLSPGQSRNLNQHCLLADYYSSHDLWHFFSALFLLFQLLLVAHISHGLQEIVSSHHSNEIEFALLS